ncbi:MAG: NADH-quinone oxidoreductase subunit N [Gemmatimonadaceae bacterium]
MPLDLSVPGQLTWALFPDVVLMGGAMLLLVWAAWRPEGAGHQRAIGKSSMLLVLVTIGLVAWFAVRGVTAGPGVVAADLFRWLADLVFLGGALLTLALAVDYNVREGITAPESHVLVLLATAGMMLLAASRDLMVLFLGIELMSVSSYVLTGLNRRSPKSAEGALKYFLLGAFSTAFLLYGIALTYGATGHTDYAGIARALTDPAVANGGLLKVGAALLVVGLGFKVAAVPFHAWAPDAYEGAPTPITAFMAASVKAAAFAAFLRLFVEALPATYGRWHLPLWYLAAATMIVGNIAALAQRNIKRLLAYSSVAQAGYVLIAVVVGIGTGLNVGVSGSSAFLFYLIAYTLSTMGAFAVVSALGTAGEPHLGVEDYSGLWTVRPGLTLAMSVFMFALLGFPVFGGVGMWAKWYMLQAALRGGTAPQTYLAVILVLTSVLSAGYYLYVVTVMFMRPRPASAGPLPPVGGFTNAVIGVTVTLILLLGFAPSNVLRAVSQATLTPGAYVAPPRPAAPAPAGVVAEAR